MGPSGPCTHAGVQALPAIGVPDSAEPKRTVTMVAATDAHNSIAHEDDTSPRRTSVRKCLGEAVCVRPSHGGDRYSAMRFDHWRIWRAVRQPPYLRYRCGRDRRARLVYGWWRRIEQDGCGRCVRQQRRSRRQLDGLHGREKVHHLDLAVRRSQQRARSSRQSVGVSSLPLYVLSGVPQKAAAAAESGAPPWTSAHAACTWKTVR